jgi:riboflavin biosynthesis pyrimidine reductase
MADESMVLETVRRYFEFVGADVERAEEIYHDDAVLEFPQSGERFEGVTTFTEWRRQYPADPAQMRFRIRRVTAVDVVARLKEESEVPLRSHGSLSLNRALMAAGLVDYVQVTLFPVITGQTGSGPIFQGAADFDLELIETRTFDGRIQELICRPTLHV